jgi:hypothetical protein
MKKRKGKRLQNYQGSTIESSAPDEFGNTVPGNKISGLSEI